MSLVAADFPDGGAVVMTEVIDHLGEVDHRRVASPLELAAAWREVRDCDAAVVEVLGVNDRVAYEGIVRSQPKGTTRSRRSADSSLRMSVSRLHVAIHRRIILLQDINAQASWFV